MKKTKLKLKSKTWAVYTGNVIIGEIDHFTNNDNYNAYVFLNDAIINIGCYATKKEARKRIIARVKSC